PMNVENAKVGAPNDWPVMGAIVRRLQHGPESLPSAITLPEHLWNTGGISWPGQDGGFLGRSVDPWLIMCDPSNPGFRVPGLGLPAEVPPLRLQARRSLLEQVNHHLDAAERATETSRYDSHSRQAFDLLRSHKARQAFDLHRESPAVRDRYG